MTIQNRLDKLERLSKASGGLLVLGETVEGDVLTMPKGKTSADYARVVEIVRKSQTPAISRELNSNG